MPFYPDNAQFEDLLYRDRRDLINKLNDNSAWKEIAAYVVEVYGLRRSEWFDDVEREANATHSHAELLLDKLRSRECDVGMLREMLEACELFDAEYIIADDEEVEIQEEPNPNANEISYEVAIGETFSVSCKARGRPPPRYKWLHGNVEIDGQTSSTLSMVIKSADQEGEYYCKISQVSRDDELLQQIESNCVNLKVKSTPVEILKQPVPVKVPLGKDFMLSCEAKGHPNPTYQWYRDNILLDGENGSTLQGKEFNPLKHKGEYRCNISNASGSIWTNTAKVKEEYPPQKAVAKIALLIANSNYQHYKKLGVVHNDAAGIAKKLEDIGFKVLCLQDCTLKEMRAAVKIFCAILMQGVYGLFYFVGHGFQMHNVYMMPVDIPEKFLTADAYSLNEFLSHSLEKKPALLVVIQDMCLTVPDKKSNPEIHEQVPEIYKYKSHNNLIVAYSTSSFSPSYEKTDASNGPFATEFMKHISNKKEITKLITDVACAVRELCKVMQTPSDQSPMITQIPKESYRCLTDAVINDESTAEYHTYVNNLISFGPKKVKIKFTKCRVIASVVVEFPNLPFMNVIQLTTSGLKQWHVSFDNCTGNQLELHPTNGNSCRIYNPQRITVGAKKALMIKIKKSETVHDSVCFPYLKHAPKVLSSLQ